MLVRVQSNRNSHYWLGMQNGPGILEDRLAVSYTFWYEQFLGVLFRGASFYHLRFFSLHFSLQVNFYGLFQAQSYVNYVKSVDNLIEDILHFCFSCLAFSIPSLSFHLCLHYSCNLAHSLLFS